MESDAEGMLPGLFNKFSADGYVHFAGRSERSDNDTVHQSGFSAEPYLFQHGGHFFGIVHEISLPRADEHVKVYVKGFTGENDIVIGRGETPCLKITAEFDPVRSRFLCLEGGFGSRGAYLN